MLIGEKVNVRAINKEDLRYLNIWKNDEQTFRFLGGGYSPTSPDYQEKWLDSLIDTTGNDKRFVICEKSSSIPVGYIGLYNINWIHRVCEVGAYIGNVEYKRKGYMREAYMLTERFARNYLNLRKINLCVVSDNEAAVEMWLSFGYTQIGEYNKERYIDGEYRNLLIMEKFIN